jgi:hypothetical protein
VLGAIYTYVHQPCADRSVKSMTVSWLTHTTWKPMPHGVTLCVTKNDITVCFTVTKAAA